METYKKEIKEVSQFKYVGPILVSNLKCFCEIDGRENSSWHAKFSVMDKKKIVNKPKIFYAVQKPGY